MIKSGQIYRTQGIRTTFLVTAVGNEDFFVISPDGSSARYDIRFAGTLQENTTLLAQYPSWQEAVNSPEFNGSILQ